MDVPTGILMVPQHLSPDARKWMDRVLAPELFEAQAVLSETLELERDYLPYIFGVSGWIVAIIAVLAS